jgi:plasmid stability protein
MSLRDIPEPLHQWLQNRARANHRSLNREVIALLDEARLAGVAGGATSRPTVESLMAIGADLSRVPDRAVGLSDDELLGIDPLTGLPWQR